MKREEWHDIWEYLTTIPLYYQKNTDKIEPHEKWFFKHLQYFNVDNVVSMFTNEEGKSYFKKELHDPHYYVSRLVTMQIRIKQDDYLKEIENFKHTPDSIQAMNEFFEKCREANNQGISNIVKGWIPAGLSAGRAGIQIYERIMDEKVLK